MLRLLFLLFPFVLIQTDRSVTLKKTILGPCDRINTDEQGNLYVIKSDVVSKYDLAGNLIKTFSNKSLGNISSIDVSNPLKLVLFYKNFTKVVFLDNTLSFNGSPISLDNIGFQQAQLACYSFNNCMWIYDQQNMELIRLNENMQPIQRSGNILQLTGMAMEPNFLVEHDNKVYLNNPQSGIMIFDIYGTYYKTIPIKGLKTFKVSSLALEYDRNGKLYKYNFKSLDTDSLNLGLNPEPINIRSEGPCLYTQFPDSVSIFTLK